MISTCRFYANICNDNHTDEESFHQCTYRPYLVFIVGQNLAQLYSNFKKVQHLGNESVTLRGGSFWISDINAQK